jgi:hypothetical protein
MNIRVQTLDGKWDAYPTAEGDEIRDGIYAVVSEGFINIYPLSNILKVAIEIPKDVEESA